METCIALSLASRQLAAAEQKGQRVPLGSNVPKMITISPSLSIVFLDHTFRSHRSRHQSNEPIFHAGSLCENNVSRASFIVFELFTLKS